MEVISRALVWCGYSGCVSGL